MLWLTITDLLPRGLIMGARTTRTTDGHTSGITNRTGLAADAEWSFYGNTGYEGNINEDLDALTSDVYPSTDCNTSTSSISHNHIVETRGNTFVRGTSTESIYADTTASLIANTGSAHDVTTIGSDGQGYRRILPSRFDSQPSGPNQFEMWMSTQDRYDLVFYQGVQPATKKHKAAKGRSDKTANKSLSSR